ncbi:hypothetical protein FB004_11945 [Sinorhizobium medicae]|uniref:hypothetical protein n=1 Tax=Sinorhizobium medicae TaxID=110321 RepID=UPI0011A3CD5B|nr:hypothetical protein [Sinorhizobium medicae]TWA15964.1 hypothetical protein FB004_11945 [Sinorhizobium medicae]
MKTTEVAELVNERMAHFNQQGIHGEAVYDALAVDPNLPMLFDPPDIEAISGDTRIALKFRRHRGQPPSFLRLSGKRVAYPRFELFQWLKARYVGRSSNKASEGYTRAAAE